MSVKVSAEYLGDLRCLATHGPSGAQITTDAPVDNHGKGAMFSPTDLVGASLITCIATIMGIQANILKVDLKGMKLEAEKEMSADMPRRIAKITIHIWLPNLIEERHQRALIKAAESCPVHHSLHPDIDCKVNFHWKESQ